MEVINTYTQLTQSKCLLMRNEHKSFFILHKKIGKKLLFMGFQVQDEEVEDFSLFIEKKIQLFTIPSICDLLNMY
jgi:hypothetical protein